MNDDELKARLQAADPARRTTPPASWIDDLVEATMSSPDPTRAPRRRWVPLAAAAAVLAAIGGGAWVAVGGDETPPAAAPTVLELTVPASDPMAMCMRFEVATLRNMETAFDGTATSVTDDTVTLDVNHWYKGGTADVVELRTFDTTGILLEGGIEYEQGKRYLITAHDGTVNICGFSMEWSEESAAVFDEAF